jgi:predicted membrane channel-forming protein YqfA (hemolysin III family)
MPYLLLFTLVFAVGLTREWGRLALRNLYRWDEAVNSTVSANLTRRLFPAMVRINPLVDPPGDWTDGPYWQHIPPLFTYVPLPLFLLDGHVTVEMKRLSYALVVWSTGIGFLLVVCWFDPSRLARVAGLLAAVLWLQMPYIERVVIGWEFGASDLVLAGSVVLCLGALLHYLEPQATVRRGYSARRLAVYAAVVSLPVVVKSALGLIPAATYFGILVWERRRLDRRLAAAALVFVGILVCAFLPLYLSSPETFRREIRLPLNHMGSSEGWVYPWHYFVTNYLPKVYLLRFTPWVYGAFLLGTGLLLCGQFTGRARTLLALCGGWFLWNLAAISAVTTKCPNFIMQGMLPLWFFCIYAPVRWSATRLGAARRAGTLLEALARSSRFITPVLAACTLFACAKAARRIYRARTSTYSYRSTGEQMYQLAEIEQERGADAADLFILDTSAEDCWLRYPIIFLTGAEARTLDEMLYYNVSAAAIRAKYRAVHLITLPGEGPPALSADAQTVAMGSYKVLSLDAATLAADYRNQLAFWVAQAPLERAHEPDRGCPSTPAFTAALPGLRPDSGRR